MQPPSDPHAAAYSLLTRIMTAGLLLIWILTGLFLSRFNLIRFVGVTATYAAA